MPEEKMLHTCTGHFLLNKQRKREKNGGVDPLPYVFYDSKVP
jgi:hypothetical protein